VNCAGPWRRKNRTAPRGKPTWRRPPGRVRAAIAGTRKAAKRRASARPAAERHPGPRHHGDRTSARERGPASPQVKVRQAVRAHDPDEPHPGESRLQPADGVDGIACPDPPLEIGDDHRGAGGPTGRSALAASSRAAVPPPTSVDSAVRPARSPDPIRDGGAPSSRHARAAMDGVERAAVETHRHSGSQDETRGARLRTCPRQAPGRASTLPLRPHSAI